MALQVFTGAFAELEAHLVKDLQSKKPLDPVLVIARSQRVARRLQQRLADPIAFNIHWSTLEAITEQIAADHPDDRVTIRDPFVLQHLILELIRECFNGSVYLSKAIRSHKTAAALSLTLRDLKEADIPLDQLSAVLTDPGIVDKDRLEEIFKLYELYEQALGVHKIHDRDDLLRLAADHAKESPRLAEIQRIYFYGFYDLNQLQWTFMEEVARAWPTHIYFPVTSAPAAEFARRFFSNYVQPLAARLQAPIRALESPLRFPDALFTDELVPQKAPVRIVNASGRHDEVWFAAKHIVRLLQDGVPPHDIAVIARSLQDYAEIISTIFRDNKIPFTISAKESIRTWPIVQTIEQLVDLPGLDFERSAVLKVLASGYFKKPADADPTLWNLATSLSGIGRGEKTWLDRLQTAIDKGGVLRDAEDHESETTVPADQLKLLKSSFEKLVNSLKSLPQRAGWSTFVQATVKILRELLSDTDRVVEVLRDLEALEHVWLGRQIDRREFVESLVEKLEQTMLPGEQNFPGVMVLDAMAARGLFFKHVTILGVNEKVFPRFVSEEPFLNDHNRALIAMTLDAKLDTKREAVQHEKWLFYLALSSGEQVTLSYQRANDEGRVLAPSVFLREVAYRLPEAQGKTFDEYVLEHVPQCNRMQLGQSEPLETLTPGELLMRVDDESVFEKFAGDRDIFRRALEAVRASETADRLGPRDGILGAAFKSHWAKYSGRISPTFLERYAICPMACLLGRVIGLQPFERPEEIEQVAPLDLGNIAHQTLAAFYEAYDGRDPMALLDRVWNRVTAKFDEQRFVRYPLLWSIDKRRLYHALRRFLSEYDLPAWEKNPIVRKRCEVEPPGSVAIPGIDGVKFKGTLDRLFELSDGTVRVDDYKWKVKGQGGAVNAALQGRAIQLAIYTRLAGAMVPEAQRIHANLILLRRLLHPETLKEALGEEPVKIFDALPEDFWKENGDRFAANMSSLVDLLSRGIFFVNPSDACSSCDYSTTCRKSHYPTAQRPVDDPAVAPYWEVRNSK